MTAPAVPVTLRRVHLALVAVVVLMTACANPDGAEPSTSQLIDAATLPVAGALPATGLSAARWPQAQWWQRYRDPQLDAIMAETLAQNPSLRLAQARVRQAVAAGEVAEATGALQVGLNEKSVYERFSANSTVPATFAGKSKWFNETTLNVGYEIDFWGKNQALLDAALDRAHAAEVDARAARLMLASSVVQTYFSLAQCRAQWLLAEKMLRERQGILDLTRQRVAAGIDSAVDLKPAESAVLATRGQMAALSENSALLRNRLAALMGKGPDRGLALQWPRLALAPVQGLPSRLPAELIGHRPDVVAQRWRVEAAGRDVAVASAQFYPNISLLAYDGFQSIGFTDVVQSGSRINGIGPALSLPLFDGGRLRGNLGARHAEYDMAVENYNQTLVDALQDVASQVASIRWLSERREQQRLALATAEASCDLSRQRYRSGLVTYLQVLAAQLQADTQAMLLIELDVRAGQLDASLVRALGGDGHVA